MDVKLTILCENSVRPFGNFIGEHGFSCYFETRDHNFLFDTGQGLGIIHNSAIFNIDFSKIDGLIISHGHWDHTGGLDQVLELSGPKPVYAHPDIFNERYSEKENAVRYGGIKYLKKYLETLGGNFIFNKDFSQIAKGIYLTGEIPRVNDFEINPSTQFVYDGQGQKIPDPLKDDNTVVIDTSKGLVVLLGCAHAGVVNILDYVYKKLGKNIYAVIGGTHLKPANNERLLKTIQKFKEYDIQYIGTSHCTGLEKAADLYKVFSERFFFASAGTEFTV